MTSSFNAHVAYRQPSFADLKKAFDWVHDGYNGAEFKAIDICKDVSTESRERKFELVHLNKERHTNAILDWRELSPLFYEEQLEMCTNAILAELNKRVLRPALYEELLTFAAKYPDEQRKYPIVALGSVCRRDDFLRSPCVCEGGYGRGLDKRWINSRDPWDRYYRFLAVPK